MWHCSMAQCQYLRESHGRLLMRRGIGEEHIGRLLTAMLNCLPITVEAHKVRYKDLPDQWLLSNALLRQGGRNWLWLH